MGYRHSKGDILDAALVAAFEDSLSQLTFGRVAKQLGVSDRIVVYYFPTKHDLVSEVLTSMGLQLQSTLQATLSVPVSDHLELLKMAWPLLARPEADPVFALFFEAGGLAAAGRQPYDSLVPQLVEGWIDWTSQFIVGTAARRRAEASAAIAVLDGLLLLRQLGGAKAATRAARTLGIATTGQPRSTRTAGPDL